jgi:glycosyltransferase involved in cell wall biosynthesis
VKKITFLMLHLNYGGLEKQTITLINELVKTGKYDITIISVYDLLEGKSFYDIDNRVKIKFLGNFGPHHKEFFYALKHFKIFSLIKETIVMIKCGIYKSYVLKKCIKSLDTDVIVSSRIEFSKLIKRHDVLNISQEHSYITTKKYINRVKRCFKNIDYIIVMTKKAKEDYELWLKNSNSNAKVYNISNMIEKTEETDIAKFENNTIISVGRLEKVKDFPTLIEVFNLVHKKSPNTKLKIVGEGSQREILENKINEYGLKDYVTITGKIDSERVKDELVSSSVFVLTSVCESFSLVLCEAMECGLPSLSFNIDVGPKEIIKSGFNGILVDDRDINKMADEVLELLNNKEKWSKISLNSLDEVKKYHSYNVAQKWIEILEK